MKVLSYLQMESILAASLVCRKWRELSNDPLLWRNLCTNRGWAWKPTFRSSVASKTSETIHEDDEGYDDEEIPWFFDQDAVDSPMSGDSAAESSSTVRLAIQQQQQQYRKPNYKLLYKTHIRLLSRVRNCDYALSYLQDPDFPIPAHTHAIYCLQIFTYPSTGEQVLFTGSKDRTVREWDLYKGVVKRVITGGHLSSVLTLWVHADCLVTGGSDRAVIVRKLEDGRIIKQINDHTDSVLCKFSHRPTYTETDLKLRCEM